MKTIISTIATIILTATTFAQKINPITGAFTITNPTCHSYSNGEVSILPAGGLAPYTYIWSTGDTTQTVTGLPAGAYSVSVTDAIGQSLIGMATLQEPAPILVEGVVTNTSSNTSNGIIDITNIYGAVGEFTWIWTSNNDQALNPSTFDQSNLKAGSYKFTITDGNGCQSSTLFQVNNFVKPLINNTIGGITNNISALLPTENNNTTRSNRMEIEIYPNPSNGDVSIEFESDVKEIVVKSATGRVIKTGNSNTTLVGLERGDYFVQYSNGVETQVKRFVVM